MLALTLSLSLGASASVPPAHLRGAVNPRPILSGPVERVDVEDFRVHFTREGIDAPERLDRNDNDLPDLVDEVIAGLQLGRDVYASEGWRPLIGDTGDGGSEAIDVYVRVIPVNGRAFPLPGPDGAACFLEVDPGLGTTSGIAQSVAVHELHHCIQFRYNAALPGWLYESASTYEQYSHVTNPALALALRLLYFNELNAMDTRLASETGSNDPYTSFLWMKFWTELDAGEPAVQRLPALWEDLAGSPRWRDGMAAAARREFGLPLELTYLLYASWNGFACGSDTGQHYTDTVLPCDADFTVQFDDVPIGVPVSIEHDEGPFTAAYLRASVEEAETLQLTCAGNEVYASWQSLDSAGALLHARDTVRPGQPLRVEVPALGTARAVVVGTRGVLNAECLILRVAPGEPSGCHHTGTASWALLLGIALHARSRRTKPKADETQADETQVHKNPGARVSAGVHDCGDRI